MIKAVLFDLDNTLIDFMRMKKMSIEESVDAMIDSGLNIKKDDAIILIYKLYEKKGIEDKNIFQKFLKKVTGRIDYKILANGIVAYRRVRSSFLAPYPRVRNTLLKLKSKGLKTAVVTDAPKLKAWIRLCSMKLDDIFDVVIAYEDTKKHKPSKLPFKKALEELKVMPEECLMVGDWPERDIKGAKKLGMKTCFAKYGAFKQYGKVNADYIIENIEELLRIIG